MSPQCLDCRALGRHCDTCIIAITDLGQPRRVIYPGEHRGNGHTGTRNSPERHGIAMLCQYASSLWRVVDSLAPYAAGAEA